MLHTAGIEISHFSARAMEIPLFTGETEGKKEKELTDIKETVSRARRNYDFEILASGGIRSVYQRDRIEKIAKECDLIAAVPLWGIDQRNYMRKIVDKGYRFILTSVSAEGLDESWLGKEVDKNAVEQLKAMSLKHGFNPSFEGGEAETLVLDCPLFDHEYLKIVDSEKIWNGYFGYLQINRAELVSKPKKI